MEFKLKHFEKKIDVTRMANIHYFEFAPEYQTFKDNHAFCELVYVDVGSINVDAQNYTGTLEANMMLIHKAGETHSLTCTGDTTTNVIIIGFECKAPELEVFSKKPIILTQEQQRLLTDVVKEGRTVFLPPYDIPNLTDMKKRRDYPFGADQMIKLKLETFLIEIIRTTVIQESGHKYDSSDPKTYEIYTYIKKNFREKISLNEICFLYGTNKSTLCRTFREFYGQTIVGFITGLKVKEAKKMMREGTHNMTEIATMLGFSSVHYFSRIFKKEVDMSPTEYIKTIKSKLEE
ncbi:MAG: helix-turn-helix transcriptional regulator [Clostridia bacterium]|nr:helix-turn-helix transcriptional regulator [Clostridia bacterium]